MCGEGAGGSGRERVEDTAARRRTAIISTPLIPRNRSARIILFFVGYGVAKCGAARNVFKKVYSTIQNFFTCSPDTLSTIDEFLD